MARALNEKLCSVFSFSVWINIPMVHPSRFSPICEAEYDTWEWWDEFRTYCNYDKRLGVALDLCDVKHLGKFLENYYELSRTAAISFTETDFTNRDR